MPEPDAETFWPLVKRYRALGLDPLKWIAGCSVEVDREAVVYPALTSARDDLASAATTVMLRQGPDVFELREAPGELVRVVTRPGSVAAVARKPRRANPLRASMIGRFFEPRAESPELFGRALVEAVARLPPVAGSLDLDGPLTLGSLHAVTTRNEEAEFASFEFYAAGAGRARGHRAVSAESLQVTDATLDPLAEEHAVIVSATALSGLFALGITEGTSLAPVFDAAGRKASDLLAANFHAASSALKAELIEREPLGTGKLFMGCVAAGQTERAVPNRHHYVKRGMQVTLTRPFGELVPLAAYLACLADPNYLAKLESSGLGLADLEEARKDTIRALCAPARQAGEVIAEFSPPFDEPPELANHIAASLQVGSRGVLAVGDLARSLDSNVRLSVAPLSHPEISSFASKAGLVENATATTHGAIAIIAYPSVLDEVDRALREKGCTPSRVGEVLGRGAALRVPPGVAENIASTLLRSSLVVEEPTAAG